MNHSEPATPRTGPLLIAGLLVIFCLKLLFAFALDLYSDEVFYWQASTRPALAYSDLPFMTAMLSGLGTALFGHSAVAVRSFFLLLGTTIPLLIYWVALPLVPKRQAHEAAALCLCLPLLAFLGLLAVPDVPLLFLGLVFIGSLERATRLNSNRFWFLTGIAAAMGVSTHYRFSLYILATLIYLLAFRDQHRHWRTPGLWVAVALLLIGLYPTVVFNLSNQLSGIDYHLLERHPWEFQTEGLLHLFKQAVLVTPLLYVAFLFTLLKLLKSAFSGDSRRGLFAVLAATNLGIYMILAPWTDSTRTSIHWPLSGYLPLLVFLPEALRILNTLIADRFGHAIASRLLKSSIAIGFAGSLIALLGVGSQSLQDVLRPFIGKGILSNKMAGWRSFEEHVTELLQQQGFGSDTLFVTDNYYTSAQLELAFGSTHVYNIDIDKAVRDGRAVQYAMWNKNETGLLSEKGRDGLFITEDSTLTVPDKIEVLARACRQFMQLQFLQQLELFDGEKSFSFYRGFQAGGQEEKAICPLPSLGWVDTPTESAEIHDSLLVTGWVINEGLGVESIEVLIDGKATGIADYGLPRPDVVEVMNVQSDPNAPGLGFQFSLPSFQIGSGEHELQLRVKGRSGEIQYFGARKFRVGSSISTGG